MSVVTYGPEVVCCGGWGAACAVWSLICAVAASGAGGVADGAAASGGGVSTCFQSCPSSTMRAMRVPRRTFRLPSSICERFQFRKKQEKELTKQERSFRAEIEKVSSNVCKSKLSHDVYSKVVVSELSYVINPLSNLLNFNHFITASVTLTNHARNTTVRQ